MKQASLFILAIIMAISSFSNNPLPDNGDCFTLTKDHDSASIVLPPPMVEIMSEIISAIGIKQDFILKEANVLNLQATMLHRKKVILYNPEFMNTINHLTKDKWPAYALLAHEIGHQLLGSNDHSARGLMRETWTADELTRNRPEDWQFSSAQRAALHARWASWGLGRRAGTRDPRSAFGS